jgi:hypothetical protein
MSFSGTGYAAGEVLGAPLWARTSHVVIFPPVCRWGPRKQEGQQRAANTAEQ